MPQGSDLAIAEGVDPAAKVISDGRIGEGLHVKRSPPPTVLLDVNICILACRQACEVHAKSRERTKFSWKIKAVSRFNDRMDKRKHRGAVNW